MRLPVAKFVRYRNADQDPWYNNKEVKGAIWRVEENAPLWHGNDISEVYIETAVVLADHIDPGAIGKPGVLAVILDSDADMPDIRFQILIGWSTLNPTHEEALIDAGLVPVGRT